MNFFKKILGKSTAPAKTEQFWEWFVRNQGSFYGFVKGKDRALINVHFLVKIMPELHRLNKVFYCETGMFNDATAELVITAEGEIKSFVLVEDLVAAAPPFENWKITALKPSTRMGQVRMDGYNFDSSNIHFFCEEEQEYPDEINLRLVHTEWTDENKKSIARGCLIYLDSLLGELDAATLIDSIGVVGPGPENKELVSMEKLGEFLHWREKEFLEKYDGTRHDTEHDTYTAFEAEYKDGHASIAVINTELLEWDAKASHPWMMVIDIDYEKTGRGRNGMPDDKHQELMSSFEDELCATLIDSAGYLNLGRETGKGKRVIYFAYKEFRISSRTVSQQISKYHQTLACTYNIYKDKYWRTMNRFRVGAPD
jgi:hypothetical protein